MIPGLHGVLAGAPNVLRSLPNYYINYLQKHHLIMKN